MAVLKREKPIVNSCCCGCSLYTGTLTFTILDLINALLSALMTIVIALALQTVVQDDKLSGDAADLVSGLYGLFIVLAVYYIIVVILSILAIHGARTTSPKLLIPWLVSLPVRELMRIIISIVVLAKAADYADALVEAYLQLGGEDDGSLNLSGYDASQFKGLMVSQAVGIFIEVLILVYVFLVVYSFYLEARRMQQAGRPAYAGGAAGYAVGGGGGGGGGNVMISPHQQQY